VCLHQPAAAQRRIAGDRAHRREGAGDWRLTQPRRSLLVLTERFDRAWDRTILPEGLPERLPQASGAAAGERLLTLTFRRVVAADGG
jgi:hypothetical protein